MNYLYNEDQRLLDELPSEVEIHRARYIEPTLRGMRMALGGADRRFVTLKAAGLIHGQSSSISASNPAVASITAKRRVSPGNLVAGVIGDWPDRYWTWTGSAFRLASKLIKEYDIQLLYTSANPISFIRAATRLKKIHDLTWLFDSRDPLGYGQKHSASDQIAAIQERWILREAIKRADHVSGLARSYGQIFFDLYGLAEERWSFIPTGLDNAYIQQETPHQRENFLLHVGEVMPNQSAHCFRVLEHLLQQTAGSEFFDRLIFVGRREINEPIIRRMTENLPLIQKRLEFLDHRPQSDVYLLMQRARACLLVPGLMRYWWNNFAKMVDYIGLGVPVIAHVPPISEAREELGRAGTAIFLQGEIESDAKALSDWLGQSEPPARSAYAERYTAHRQVSDFALLFNRLLDKRR